MGLFRLRKDYVVFIWLVAACSQNPVIEGDLNEIMVRAILSPDFNRQSILVVEGKNLVLISEIPAEQIEQPLKNARVVVRGADQEILFSEVSPGLYQDVQMPLKVIPGQTYYLEITDKRGRIVRGHTTVPASFHIISPKDGLVVRDGDRVLFIWEPSVGAMSYHIRLVVPECARIPGRPATILVGGANFNESRDSVPVRMFFRCDTIMQKQQFKVIALDSAYSLYNFQTGQPFLVNFKNLDNALGLFGSMVSDSVTIVVVPRK